MQRQRERLAIFSKLILGFFSFIYTVYFVLGMDKCAQYWPLEEKEVKTYGDVEVTNTLVRPLNSEEPNIRLSILSLKWSVDGKEKTRDVRHYQVRIRFFYFLIQVPITNTNV